MTDDFVLEDLDPEEAKEFLADVAAAKAKVTQRREDKRQAELATEYAAEMNSHRGQPNVIREIKEKFRRRGLDVDRVVFH